MGNRVSAHHGRGSRQARSSLITRCGWPALTLGLAVLGLLQALACSSSEERPSQSVAELAVEQPDSSSAPDEEPVSPPPLAVGNVPSPGEGARAGSPARLKLRPSGLTPIYAGYFQNPEVAAALAEELGVFWPGMNVLVEGAWTSMAEGGSLSLFVPLGEGRTPVVAAALRADHPIDVSEIEQLIAPLGSFRAALGARFDLRFLSFELRVIFHDPRTGRSCVATGEAADPSGSQVASCFTCSRASGPENLCRLGDAWPARLGGSPEGLAQFAAALAN